MGMCVCVDAGWVKLPNRPIPYANTCRCLDVSQICGAINRPEAIRYVAVSCCPQPTAAQQQCSREELRGLYVREKEGRKREDGTRPTAPLLSAWEVPLFAKDCRGCGSSSQHRRTAGEGKMKRRLTEASREGGSTAGNAPRSPLAQLKRVDIYSRCSKVLP